MEHTREGRQDVPRLAKDDYDHPRPPVAEVGRLQTLRPAVPAIKFKPPISK